MIELDIEAIKERHFNPKRMVMRTYYEGHVEVDLAACVDEIERLRVDRAAVLTYLRSRPGYGPLADAIERGDHIAEDKR